MIYSVFSGVCIVALVAICAYFAFEILRRNREGKIEFLRTFKKGKCAIVYLVAVPLYWMGQVFGGAGLLSAVFSSIAETMTLVVLRYDATTITGLMEDNLIYEIAVYFCFVLVAINAMLFTFSIVHQAIWTFFVKRQCNKTKLEKLLIIGNNPENVMIYNSAQDRYGIIMGKLTDKEKEDLYRKNVRYITVASKSDMYENLIKECINDKSRRCIIVVNTKNDEENISICKKIIKAYKVTLEAYDENDTKEIVKDLLSRFRVHVYGDMTFEEIYNNISDSSYGCIRYTNKYRQIAADFIDRYPLTQFMTGEEIDYENALLKDAVDVNVIMIGFGKTNRQIFLMSTANNQFLAKTENGIDLKQVTYHIYDKNHSENNKNLNHSYYRYRNEVCNEPINKEDYLPLPALPAKEYYNCLDINDTEFYKSIRQTITKSEKDLNYVIIAFGTDLENIDFARKLLAKKSEWQVKKMYVFVKVRGGDKNYDIFTRDDCFVIGEEKVVAYDINMIDNDMITRMAKLRNKIYDLEYMFSKNGMKPMSQEEIENSYKNSDYKWHVRRSQFERESNIYGCLSIRTKLHMIGLDYTREKISGITEEEYMDLYAVQDKPMYHPTGKVQGKKIVQYPVDFIESKRKNMAVHEHYRWNSFMISKGFIPATIKEILEDTTGNGKSYKIRRHGNLTTFDGLIDFRKIVAKRNDTSEGQEDVIKYDYQLMDDAYWLLSTEGYTVYKREQ